jgi:hypothetical protein
VWQPSPDSTDACLHLGSDFVIVIKKGDCFMARFTDVNGRVIEFDLDKVKRVYSGKPHTCMCGCAGKYFEKGSSMIGRVVGYFERFIGNIENLDNYIFTIITSPTRQYTIYLEKK